MKRVASFVGCTEGQAYTLVLAALLAVVLLAVTIPATSRGRAAATLAGAPVEVPPFRAPSDPEPSAPAVAGDGADGSLVAEPPAAVAGGPPPLALPTFRTAGPVGPPPNAADDRAEAGPEPGAGPAAPAPGASTPTTPSSASTPAAPLRIVESGWATTGAGTPAARLGVPPGTLPVATDAAGATTRRSFVRLSGDATALVLGVRRDSGATFGEDTAAVAACAITDAAWRPGEAQPLDVAPAFDPGRCAGGVRRPDGTWAFDLAGLTTEERTGRAGLTLVADPAVPRGPFQIAFDPAVPGATP